MTEPTVAFPDLFVFTLHDRLQTDLVAYGTDTSASFFKRPLRPADPNFSVGVFEADMEPIEYEIGNTTNPSLMRWNAGIQVLVKDGNEESGRAARAKLLWRVRQTLFSSGCVSAVMTLRDSVTNERCTKYRLKRIAYASGDANEAHFKYYIGQVEVYFDTEFH